MRIAAAAGAVLLLAFGAASCAQESAGPSAGSGGAGLATPNPTAEDQAAPLQTALRQAAPTPTAPAAPTPTTSPDAAPTMEPTSEPTSDPSGAAVVVDSDGTVLFPFGDSLPAAGDPSIRQEVLAELLAIAVLGDTIDERAQAVAEGGLVVRISLDAEAQRQVAAVVGAVPQELDAVAVTVDNSTGEIVSAVSRGGTSLRVAQPAGSARLAIYAAALEAGMTLQSEVDGTGPCVIETDRGTTTIENYDNAPGDTLSLLEQVLRSSRCADARLEAAVGSQATAGALNRMTGGQVQGPMSDTPRLTATEHVRLVAAIAADGLLPVIGLVSEVATSDGRVIYGRAGPTRVSGLQVSNELMAVLISNVERGTGTRAQLDHTLAAGITGTDPEFRVAWFVGTADGFSTAIWVAQADGEPMTAVTSGIVSGSQVPAELWAQIHEDLGERVPPYPSVTPTPVKVPGSSTCPDGFPKGVDSTGDGVVDVCYKE